MGIAGGAREQGVQGGESGGGREGVTKHWVLLVSCGATGVAEPALERRRTPMLAIPPRRGHREPGELPGGIAGSRTIAARTPASGVQSPPDTLSRGPYQRGAAVVQQRNGIRAAAPPSADRR